LNCNAWNGKCENLYVPVPKFPIEGKMLTDTLFGYYFIVIIDMGPILKEGIQDNVVTVVNYYELDILKVEPWWRQDFPHLSRPTLRSIKPPVQGVLGIFSGHKVAGVWHQQPTPS
jgi:hypothetical protein